MELLSVWSLAYFEPEMFRELALRVLEKVAVLGEGLLVRSFLVVRDPCDIELDVVGEDVKAYHQWNLSWPRLANNLKRLLDLVVDYSRSRVAFKKGQGTVNVSVLDTRLIERRDVEVAPTEDEFPLVGYNGTLYEWDEWG
ncbi:hypothetical protein V8C35DRAFT_283167 [Trichoderma chlorosporum]